MTYVEQKPWEEIDPATDSLNQSSYAATAVWGMTEMSVEYLNDHDIEILPIFVRGMADIFATVAADVQRSFRHDETASLQQGSHVRVRGALRTALRTLPDAPFNGGDAEWEAWVERLRRRTLGIGRIAYELWLNGPAERPWSVFTPAAGATTGATTENTTGGTA